MPTLKKKYTPTPEQREAARARRAKIHQLAKTIGALTEDQRLDLASRSPLVTCEGHRLSPFNTCLVTYQDASCTILGGLQQWRKAGRQVRKGAHGVAIFVPRWQDTPEATSITPEDKTFLLVTLFDITQTDPLEDV